MTRDSIKNTWQSLKLRQSLVMFFFFTLLLSFSYVSADSISLTPETIIQGDPVMITILGTTTFARVQTIKIGNETLQPFLYDGMTRAFYGVDLTKKPGTYVVTATLMDGTVFTQVMIVEARKKIEAPLGIPTSLGGDTPKSQKKLVDTLATENLTLLHLETSKKALWKKPFQYPVENPIVTDEYGYTRQTGSYSILHKGTDFKASTGTKILAMNRGIVRVAKKYRDYGNTIVVDHGLGVMTFYMHLSKLKVKKGHVVEQGQVIGLSGKTGYAESPHLHLTVRINNISIDPVVFMSFFK